MGLAGQGREAQLTRGLGEGQGGEGLLKAGSVSRCNGTQSADGLRWQRLTADLWGGRPRWALRLGCGPGRKGGAGSHGSL